MKKIYSSLSLLVFLILLISCNKSDILSEKSNYIEISNIKYDLSNGYLVAYPTIIDRKINELTNQRNYEMKLAGNNSVAVNIIRGLYQTKIDEWAAKKTKGIGQFAILLTSSEIAIELNNNNFSKISGKGNVVLLILWASNSVKLDNGAYKLSDQQILFTEEFAKNNVAENAEYVINLDIITNKSSLSGVLENGLITINNNTISIDANSAKLGKQYLKFDKPLKQITDTNFELY